VSLNSLVLKDIRSFLLLTLLKPLRIYTLLNNLSGSLISPFVSFFVAANGIGGTLLAIVSSSTTTFPGIAQYLLVNFYIRAKRLILLGTLISGVLWLLIGLLKISNSLFVLIYVIISLSLGISSFGLLLILDKVSETARGKTLASYNFYGYIGGLTATFITGFIVGDQLHLMSYFFIIGGIIYLINAYVIYHSDVDVEMKSKAKLFTSNPEVRKFLLINFIFTFIWAMAWPLFPLAQVYKFHMNEFNIAVISVISGVSTLALQKFIGILVDKHRKLMMFLGRFALATFPLAYALSTSISEIYLANIVSGFTNSASISYTAYLFDSSSYQEKRTNIASFNMLNGIAALAGSTFSAFVLSLISPRLGLVMAVNLMLISIGIMRIFSSFLYLKVKEVS